MKTEYNNPVCKYWLKCTKENLEVEFTILAINSDWALSIVNNDVDWETVTLRKLSNVVGFASYGARNISNETEEIYLNHHCKPL